jgi:hypothetical protein
VGPAKKTVTISNIVGWLAHFNGYPHRLALMSHFPHRTVERFSTPAGVVERFSTPAGAVERFSTLAGTPYSSALSDFKKNPKTFEFHRFLASCCRKSK